MICSDCFRETWVIVHKFNALFMKRPYIMYELKVCRDYRDGKVTKEQLKGRGRIGEKIVDADIEEQMRK